MFAALSRISGKLAYSLPPGSFGTILAETLTSRRTRLIAATVLALLSNASASVPAAEAPAGQMTWK